MLIIYFVVLWIISAIIATLVASVIKRIRDERRKCAFANSSKQVLLAHVYCSPLYYSEYNNLRRTMGDDKAADLVIRHMLVDMGLIGYRKEGT